MSSPTLAGADPVEFRLKHLEDPRGRATSSKRRRKGSAGRGARRRRPDRGYGFAFARYKNLAAYCAVASRSGGRTGRPADARLVRAVAAVDSGQVVNPDGLTNQIEGAIVQSMSWTLYEAVTFDDTRITSIDWQTYPILRFDAVPDSIDVHIINRPGKPFLGSGETGQGPAAASIANAIANATGQAAARSAADAEEDQERDRRVNSAPSFPTGGGPAQTKREIQRQKSGWPAARPIHAYGFFCGSSAVSAQGSLSASGRRRNRILGRGAAPGGVPVLLGPLRGMSNVACGLRRV